MDFSVNREERLEKALATFGVTRKDLDDHIKHIKDWFQTQKHLPETPSDIMITNFLFIGNLSVEETKKRLDMYYTIRSLVPELYQDKHPRLPKMRKAIEEVYCIPLPTVTEEGYRVSVMRNQITPEDFEPYDVIANLFNVLEIRIQEDVTIGDIGIYDFHNVKMGHVVKLTPVVLKKSTVAFEKVFSNKMKQIHFINCPSFAENLIKLIKSLFKPKLQQRIYVHTSPTTLKEYIPMEILPKELGGTELPLKELNGLLMKKLEEYYDRFDALEKMKVNESLRPTPLVNDELLGFHGSFRKLDVD